MCTLLHLNHNSVKSKFKKTTGDQQITQEDISEEPIYNSGSGTDLLCDARQCFVILLFDSSIYKTRKLKTFSLFHKAVFEPKKFYIRNGGLTFTLKMEKVVWRIPTISKH